jgi:hypothetical protein
MKNNTFIVVVILILLAIVGYFYLGKRNEQQNLNTSENPEFTSEDITAANDLIIKVTADKGVLTPKEFRVSQTKNLVLVVTAVDRDYSFKVTGYPRLDYTMKKGESTSLLIDALGVGEYTYTCGPGCNGSIVVEQEGD